MTEKSNFYPLTAEIAKALREANLSAAEWKVWSYLAVLEPDGVEAETSSISELTSECKISKTTAYRAIAKLREAGFFEIKTQVRMFRRVNREET